MAGALREDPLNREDPLLTVGRNPPVGALSTVGRKAWAVAGTFSLVSATSTGFSLGGSVVGKNISFEVE